MNELENQNDENMVEEVQVEEVQEENDKPVTFLLKAIAVILILALILPTVLKILLALFIMWIT